MGFFDWLSALTPLQLILVSVALLLVLLALISLAVFLFVKTVIFIVETPRQLGRIADALERDQDDTDENEKGQS